MLSIPTASRGLGGKGEKPKRGDKENGRDGLVILTTLQSGGPATWRHDACDLEDTTLCTGVTTGRVAAGSENNTTTRGVLSLSVCHAVPC
jgi:hypothetical protein